MSPISKSAGCSLVQARQMIRRADWEIRDTADLEVCATSKSLASSKADLRPTPHFIPKSSGQPSPHHDTLLAVSRGVHKRNGRVATTNGIFPPAGTLFPAGARSHRRSLEIGASLGIWVLGYFNGVASVSSCSKLSSPVAFRRFASQGESSQVKAGSSHAKNNRTISSSNVCAI